MTRKLIVHPGVDFLRGAQVAKAFLSYDPPRLAGNAGGIVFKSQTCEDAVYVYRTPNGTVVVRPTQPAGDAHD